MPSKVTAFRKRAGMIRSVSMSLPVTGMPRPDTWRRLKSVALISRSPSRRRSEEHTSELQSHSDLVCRLLLEKKKIHADDPGAKVVLTRLTNIVWDELPKL